jgi:hypothetical protein
MASFNIVEWRICINYSSLYELVKWCKMSWESILDPTSAECEGRVFVGDLSQQSLGFRIPEWHWLCIEALHVMTAVISFENSTFSGGSERLNCKELTFFHSCGISALDNWYTFSRMNLIWTNRMSAQILDGLYWKNLIAHYDLM